MRIQDIANTAIKAKLKQLLGKIEDQSNVWKIVVRDMMHDKNATAAELEEAFDKILLKTLKEQADDSPSTMERALGKEITDLLIKYKLP